MANYNYVGKFLRNVVAGAPVLANPGSSTDNQFFGRRSLTSHTNVVSTTVVGATSTILVTIQNNSPISQAQAAVTWGVGSINPGNWFSINQVASIALTGSYTAHWAIFGE